MTEGPGFGFFLTENNAAPISLLFSLLRRSNHRSPPPISFAIIFNLLTENNLNSRSEFPEYLHPSQAKISQPFLSTWPGQPPTVCVCASDVSCSRNAAIAPLLQLHLEILLFSSGRTKLQGKGSVMGYRGVACEFFNHI
ncbi:hypothetical protein AAHA92_20713 [Salvia divinorum]|uniref:Uncharacterized protein n=1 Tax=Salvia divinorum TaxID=28513 RepID=A0ABD1GL27_SALDI